MSWVIANIEQIWKLTLDHVGLSIPAIVLGFLIAVPLGWVAHRYRLSRGILLTVCGLLYTIPSISLFLALPAMIGTKVLDPVNVIVAMTMYAVALMVRTATDAFDAVSSDVQQSAVAVGYSPWRKFWGVDLPLAGPVLMSGIRVVSTSTVSLVSVGSLIGVSSLGYLFLDGLNRSFPTEIWVGIAGTILIAIVFDLLIVLAGRLLMPWVRVDAAARRSRGAQRRARRTAVAA